MHIYIYTRIKENKRKVDSNRERSICKRQNHIKKTKLQSTQDRIDLSEPLIKNIESRQKLIKIVNLRFIKTSIKEQSKSV